MGRVVLNLLANNISLRTGGVTSSKFDTGNEFPPSCAGILSATLLREIVSDGICGVISGSTANELSSALTRRMVDRAGRICAPEALLCHMVVGSLN